jgi:hypothetical protein
MGLDPKYRLVVLRTTVGIIGLRLQKSCSANCAFQISVGIVASGHRRASYAQDHGRTNFPQATVGLVVLRLQLTRVSCIHGYILTS